MRVHPTMLPLSHQLATVNGVYNAIYVVGDAVGETMFFGEGAGSGPAASAVMGDVLEVARHLQAGHSRRSWAAPAPTSCRIVPMEELKTKYYIRFAVADRSGVLAAMAGVFASHDVSVHSVIQRGKKDGNSVDITYVTHTAREKSVRAVLGRHRRARRRAARGAERHPRGGLAACGRNSPQNRRYAQGRGLQKRAPLALRRRRFAADFSVVNLVIPDRR